MIRSVRSLVYFLVGFLLAFNVVFAFAETVPAAAGYILVNAIPIGASAFSVNGSKASTAQEACVKSGGVGSNYVGGPVSVTTIPGNYSAGVTCDLPNGTSRAVNYTLSCPPGYSVTSGSSGSCGQGPFTCPTGQNWTLSGSTCTRPDCESPQTRQTDGTCGAPPDACLSRSGSSYAWISSPVGSPTPDGQTYCDSGCTVGLNPAATGTAYTNGKDKIQRYEISQLAYKCADGLSNTPISIEPAKQPPETPKKPPCAATEGVLTTSSGTVACVPPGVDSNTPEVTTKKTTKSYPDGSQTIETETTTKDPGTGAKSVDVGTQTTPKTGGGTGDAGEPSETKKPTTDEKCEGPDCPKEAKKGTFVERGKLYEKKYENGPSGVMTEKFTALKTSPIFSLVSNLAPSGVVDSGSCPSWDMSLNFGPRMNFGSARLEPPCFIWGALRAIFMIMSLLLARRLVFGG